MRVYIAGPYTQGDPVLNVRAAIQAAEEVLAAGHSPYVPHLTMLWHLVAPHPVADWYAHDLDWLAVCDVVLRLDGESAGADAEEQAAREARIPVVYKVAALEFIRS